jgi:DNA-binding NarL/FixJ family response regulator
MKSVRALVVDNNTTFLSAAVRALLGDPRMRFLVCARSAHEALEQAAHFHPDVVIIEIALPDISGLELTRQIKGQAHAPFVWLFSLNDTAEYRAAAEAAGADGFLSKEDFSRECRHLLDVVSHSPENVVNV